MAKTIDLTPTRDGYRRMAELFRAGADAHRDNIAVATKMVDNWPDSYGTAEEVHIIMDALADWIAAREADIQALTDEADKIDAYLEAAEQDCGG